MARVRRWLALFAEIVFISALVVVTRCANYSDVFVDGKINFIDADCYSRMMRARICFEHPGTIVRRHDFENFPVGTAPHTTAPFDYLIVAVAAVISPFSSNALDLAGAIISPLIAIVLGIFLCWWTRTIQLRFRCGLLLLYALSPILAHGTALGRPDHQSLLIALVTVALCAQWRLEHQPTRAWGIVSGVSWGLAIWVSLYEPLVLLLLVLTIPILERFATARAPSVRAGLALARSPQDESVRLADETLAHRQASSALPGHAASRPRWISLTIIIAIALVLERRIPSWPAYEFGSALRNWSSSIGELAHVPLASANWFAWCGWLLLLAPVLLWPKQNRSAPLFLIVLLVVTFALTVWQARWSYFFVMIFALLIPEVLNLLRKPMLASAAFIIALFPIAEGWDRSFTDDELARRAENKLELLELRAISSQIDGVFIGPWWFSPALSYWARQPGVGGSSHESIEGIVETAKFFGTQNAEEAMQVCQRRNVTWIIAYDADRIAQNSSQILGAPVSEHALCYVLDRRASEAPKFLLLNKQTGRFKLYRLVKL